MPVTRSIIQTMRAAALAGLAALVCVGVAPAQAQQTVGGQLSFGGGLGVQPSYFGSDDYDVVPSLIFRFDSFQIGNLTFGSPDRQSFEPGFRVGGSFRYISDRDASDGVELEGLPEIDRTFEVGLGLSYVTEHWRLFGTMRYGAFGHEGIVGELGGDVVWRPTDELTLTLGPRAQYGDGKFTRTYFGVANPTAAFPVAYDPSGGLYSTGVEAGMVYQINDDWAVEGSARYDRLRGDAGRSPIVEQGSRDQFSVRLGVARRIQFGF